MTWFEGRERRGATGRLPRLPYSLVRRLVPIACVDILPVKTGDNLLKVGLIRRYDASGRVVRAMIGGGIHRTETVGEAAARHLRSTLGPEVRWTDPDWDRPATVGQYLPNARSDEPHDPRKHAIALTYLVVLAGTASPRGEAIGFDWFTIASAPLEEMGFGQEIVVRRVLEQLSNPARLREPRHVALYATGLQKPPT